MTGEKADVLLRFRVANHRCLREPVELSLASPRLRSNTPREGNWIDATTRVAGIYGANASGKSTILNALEFMTNAVALSATRWADEDEFPFHPYALDSKYSKVPSTYEIDIVVDGIRYTYGFESDRSEIQSEWLYSYRSPWKSLLFERQAGHEMKFGRNLPGENQTISKLVGPRNLFLSVAANSNHPHLKKIHRTITRNIRCAHHADDDRKMRLVWIREIIEDEALGDQVNSLIALADLGISGVKVDSIAINEEQREFMRRVYDSISTLSDSDRVNKIDFNEVIEDYQRQIMFTHYTDRSHSPVSFDVAMESSGTVAWLSLGVPALHALRSGHTYLVDEIDSSLHPQLTATLIQMFKDPEINQSGAQLIFTSHDVSLLGKLLGKVMNPEEIWFVEKHEGVSDLYALHEFSVRSGDNVEKRYLEGRYGAIPMIQPGEIRKLFVDNARA